MLTQWPAWSKLHTLGHAANRSRTQRSVALERVRGADHQVVGVDEPAQLNQRGEGSKRGHGLGWRLSPLDLPGRGNGLEGRGSRWL